MDSRGDAIKQKKRDKAIIVGFVAVLCLLISEILLFKRVEPFYSWFYPFAWWSYIVICDSLVYRRKGNSLIISRTGEFFLLIFWSLVIWLFFEFINLFIRNWYYINTTPLPWVQAAGFIVSYGTVLPGLFETMELLETTSLLKNSRSKPFKVTNRWYVASFIVGMICLFLPFLLPQYTFPLVWGSLIFLLEPFNHHFGGRSLLKDWEKGSPRKFYLLLLAGMICGLLWEFWNFWANTKWVYTVPFFEKIKLFEMPLLGFFGFPPFTVECYVIMSFIGLFRGKRSWEEDQYRMQISRKRPILLRGIVFIILSAWCLLMFRMIDRYTIQSYYSYLEDLAPKGAEEINRLRKAGINSIEELIELADNKTDIERLSRKSGLSIPRLNGLIDAALMTSLIGIGTKNTLLLKEAGIKKMADLADEDPSSLTERLRKDHRLAPKEKSPTEAMVMIWVRAAKKSINERANKDD